MPAEVVEVSDEQGVVKNLRNFPKEYGSDLLKERETLVLLAVQGESFQSVQDCYWLFKVRPSSQLTIAADCAR